MRRSSGHTRRHGTLGKWIMTKAPIAHACWQGWMRSLPRQALTAGTKKLELLFPATVTGAAAVNLSFSSGHCHLPG